MGSSKSKSSSSTTYRNTDNRAVADAGSIAITGSSNVTVQSIDGEIATAALEFAKETDASNAEGFEKLLGFAEAVFDGGVALANQSTAAVADAYSRSESDKAGTIDNKTIIVLGVAAAAVAIMKGKK